jgi:two-component system, NarL family, sensor histidine kinase UhpB
VLLTGLVVLAALAMFWLLVSAGEYYARPAGLSAYPSIELAGLDANGRVVRAGEPIIAHHEDPYEYVSRDRDWSVVAARYVGRFSPSTAGDHALFLTSRTDVTEVRLNGIVITPDVRRPRLNGSFVAEPAIYSFPALLMADGDNRYSITVRRNLRGPFVFPDFTVGPSAAIEPPAQFRHLMSVEIALVGIVVMLFTALLALSVAWRQDELPRNLCFVAMLASSALVSIMFMFSGAEKYDVPWLVASSLLTAFQAVCLLLYVAYDSQPSPMTRWRSVAVIGVGLAGIAIIVAIFNYRGINPHYHLFILMITCRLFSVGVCAVAVVALAAEIVRSGGQRVAERFILIIWFVATGLDQGHPGLFAVFSPFTSNLPLSLQWTPILGSLTGLAKVASLARQAGEARREVVRSNSILAQRLEQQDAELAQQYAAQTQMAQRQVVLGERERIVRDMHDGIGGQLLGLLVQVRAGDADNAVVADGLQNSITDLRLIIDSLDTAEDGLSAALLAFEHRTRILVESSGKSFTMNHGLGDMQMTLTPRDLLNILRILQEAVSNAVQHSNAAAISVTSVAQPDGVQLTVADDGLGMLPDRKSGRGILNMQTRARELGATLTIGPNADRGVRLTIFLGQQM